MPSMMSSSSAVLSRFTPGRNPPTPDEGKRICRRLGATFFFDSVWRRASSTTAVNVRPVFTAASLAWASKSSFNRIVVLIHQSIR